MSQLVLFEPPRAVVDEASVGRNQLTVLAWIDRFGYTYVREAGRLVYRNRGYDPDRVSADRLTEAGIGVLASLRRRGLVARGRGGRWARKLTVARPVASDLIGPSRSEGPILSTLNTPCDRNEEA
jgi:hypothetical protein